MPFTIPSPLTGLLGLSSSPWRGPQSPRPLSHSHPVLTSSTVRPCSGLGACYSASGRCPSWGQVQRSGLSLRCVPDGHHQGPKWLPGSGSQGLWDSNEMLQLAGEAGSGPVPPSASCLGWQEAWHLCGRPRAGSEASRVGNEPRSPILGRWFFLQLTRDEEGNEKSRALGQWSCQPSGLGT